MSTEIRFLGDSVTDAWRRYDSDGLGEGYVRFVSEALYYGYGGVSVRNLGSEGAGPETIGAVLREDSALADADILVLQTGADELCSIAENASDDREAAERAAHFGAAARSLLGEIRDRSGARLVIAEPFFLSEEYGFDTGKSAAEEAYSVIRREVKAAAEHFQAEYLPTQEIFERQKSAVGDEIRLTEDGVHPTAEGHRLLAELLVRRLKISVDSSCNL